MEVPMSHSDAFALKDSGLNEFLFAEVGTELNGSSLTILSVLARLGQDPWAEAARWTRLPKAAIIDCLAHDISQMPLCPQALVEARSTATRLIRLLPSRTQSPVKPPNVAFKTLKSVPTWLIVVLFVALGLGVAVTSFQSKPSADIGTSLVPSLGEHPQPPTN
jgi:hypothetical protein